MPPRSRASVIGAPMFPIRCELPLDERISCRYVELVLLPLDPLMQKLLPLKRRKKISVSLVSIVLFLTLMNLSRLTDGAIIIRSSSIPSSEE